MIKYTDAEVVFRELPDEITLAINISNCPCHCPGCHSSYLAKDIGDELTTESLQKLLDKNKGISAVSFMGGDSNPGEISNLAKYVKDNTNLVVGWYSGRQELSQEINLRYFDYIKLGPYIEELGPIDKEGSNQKMYRILDNCYLVDITDKLKR